MQPSYQLQQAGGQQHQQQQPSSTCSSSLSTPLSSAPAPAPGPPAFPFTIYDAPNNQQHQPHHHQQQQHVLQQQQRTSTTLAERRGHGPLVAATGLAASYANAHHQQQQYHAHQQHLQQQHGLHSGDSMMSASSSHIASPLFAPTAHHEAQTPSTAPTSAVPNCTSFPPPSSISTSSSSSTTTTNKASATFAATANGNPMQRTGGAKHPTSSSGLGSGGAGGGGGLGGKNKRGIKGSSSMGSAAASVAAGAHWSPEDDMRLRQAIDTISRSNQSKGSAASTVASNAAKSWTKISAIAFPDGRFGKETCAARWKLISKPHSIKGPWSPHEDRMLLQLVRQYGPEKWVAIAEQLGSRSGKQCRERWHNHVDPTINKAPYTPEEDALIMELVEKMGSKWAEIAKHLKGRPDNSIKNHYNTTLIRRRQFTKIIVDVNKAKDGSNIAAGGGIHTQQLKALQQKQQQQQQHHHHHQQQQHQHRPPQLRIIEPSEQQKMQNGVNQKMMGPEGCGDDSGFIEHHQQQHQQFHHSPLPSPGMDFGIHTHHQPQSHPMEYSTASSSAASSSLASPIPPFTAPEPFFSFEQQQQQYLAQLQLQAAAAAGPPNDGLSGYPPTLFPMGMFYNPAVNMPPPPIPYGELSVSGPSGSTPTSAMSMPAPAPAPAPVPGPQNMRASFSGIMPRFTSSIFNGGNGMRPPMANVMARSNSAAPAMEGISANLFETHQGGSGSNSFLFASTTGGLATSDPPSGTPIPYPTTTHTLQESTEMAFSDAMPLSKATRLNGGLGASSPLNGITSTKQGVSTEEIPVHSTPRRDSKRTGAAGRHNGKDSSTGSTPRPSLPEPKRISPTSISNYQAARGDRALPPLSMVPTSSPHTSPEVARRPRSDSYVGRLRLLSSACSITDISQAETANSTLAMMGVDEQQKGALLPAFTHQPSPARSILAKGTKRNGEDQDQGRFVRQRFDEDQHDNCATGSTVASSLLPSPRDAIIPMSALSGELENWGNVGQDGAAGVPDYMLDTTSGFDGKSGSLGLFFGSPFAMPHTRGFTASTQPRTTP